jgi:WD40 repeat protein
MKNSGIGRSAVTSCVAAVLAACSGSQPPIGTPGAMPQSGAIATHAQRGGSWVLPEAKSDDLLYVTSYTGTFYWVYMFSYPAGKLVGKIAKEVSGLCSDEQGNVYMTQSFDSKSTIFKYAHGGKKPLATLADPYNGADGCAVDRVTGDLAVANSEGETVVVYSRAQGKPKRYYVFFAPLYVAYTPKGHLFVLGGGDLAELSNGHFVRVRLTKHFDSPIGVQWDGKYLAIGSEVGSSSYYYYGLINRYTVGGRKGTLKGTTDVNTDAVGFFIEGSTAIASDGGDDVDFFNYPQGGQPTMTISGISRPGSLTVSNAP